MRRILLALTVGAALGRNKLPVRSLIREESRGVRADCVSPSTEPRRIARSTPNVIAASGDILPRTKQAGVVLWLLARALAVAVIKNMFPAIAERHKYACSFVCVFYARSPDQ